MDADSVLDAPGTIAMSSQATFVVPFGVKVPSNEPSIEIANRFGSLPESFSTHSTSLLARLGATPDSSVLLSALILRVVLTSSFPAQAASYCATAGGCAGAVGRVEALDPPGPAGVGAALGGPDPLEHAPMTSTGPRQNA